ncbi:MAG TPA: FtsX-like permease family protein, partial [Acidimicrobiales bacterium]|nr:FtsX-like permease family protein [Acidimicrobiales bacterium]
MLRSLGFLNLRRLVRQPVRALLGVVAIAAGTALAVGVLIDSASVDRSIAAFAEQRAGAGTLEVIGPGGPAGLEASTLPRIEAVDGVASAVPIISTVTIVEDAEGEERFVLAFGVDCRIQDVITGLECDQAQLDGAPDGAFAVSGRLYGELGTDAVVRTNAGRQSFANAVPVDEVDELNGGNVALFRLADAQRLFSHEGALSSILVVPEEGVSDAELAPRLREAAGEHNVVREPGIVGDPEFASMLILLLFILSLFALAIGAMLVRNAIALTLEERRRDLAVTAALGMPPRSILAGALVEAAALGA